MAIVDGSLQLGYKNSAWFTANASLVLLEGQIVYLEQTGTYKLGDGVTQLSALSFLGGSSGGSWGSITGTLSNQTDLQNELNAKEDKSNKSLDVNTDQASNIKYPSVKAVFNWAISLFVKKGTLTTNYIQKATGTDTIGNSNITDDGSNVTIDNSGYAWLRSGANASTVAGSFTTNGLSMGSPLAGFQYRVPGDQSFYFRTGDTITISGQTGIGNNNGTHVLDNVAYDISSASTYFTSPTFNAFFNNAFNTTIATSYTIAADKGEVYLAAGEADLYNASGGFFAAEAPPTTNKYFQVKISKNRIAHDIKNEFDAPANNFPQLTASQIVETDASKNLVSVAKQTGYNLALGTTAGTVLEGNRITQVITNGVTDKAPSEDAVFDALNLKRSITTEMLLFIGSFASTNLAASTTYYWSNMNGLSLTTTQSFSKFTFANNFTITKVVLTCSHNNNPTSGNTSIYIRESATTDKTITTNLDLNTVGANTSKVFIYSSLNLSVTSGLDYEMKIVTPAMATTPTNSRWHIQLWGY